MRRDQRSPSINVADVPLREQAHGDKFAAKVGRIGPLIGSTGIGVHADMVVPPGKRAFPFHVHHVTHELFVILEGDGRATASAPRPTRCRAGDVLAAPAGGPEVAHQIVNTGSTDAEVPRHVDRRRRPRWSSIPNSGKFARHLALRLGHPQAASATIGRTDGSLDYWDGE